MFTPRSQKRFISSVTLFWTVFFCVYRLPSPPTSFKSLIRTWSAAASGKVQMLFTVCSPCGLDEWEEGIHTLFFAQGLYTTPLLHHLTMSCHERMSHDIFTSFRVGTLGGFKDGGPSAWGTKHKGWVYTHKKCLNVAHRCVYVGDYCGKIVEISVCA